MGEGLTDLVKGLVVGIGERVPVLLPLLERVTLTERVRDTETDLVKGRVVGIGDRVAVLLPLLERVTLTERVRDTETLRVARLLVAPVVGDRVTVRDFVIEGVIEEVGVTVIDRVRGFVVAPGLGDDVLHLEKDTVLHGDTERVVCGVVGTGDWLPLRVRVVETVELMGAVAVVFLLGDTVPHTDAVGLAAWL